MHNIWSGSGYVCRHQDTFSESSGWRRLTLHTGWTARLVLDEEHAYKKVMNEAVCDIPYPVNMQIGRVEGVQRQELWAWMGWCICLEERWTVLPVCLFLHKKWGPRVGAGAVALPWALVGVRWSHQSHTSSCGVTLHISKHLSLKRWKQFVNRTECIPLHLHIQAPTWLWLLVGLVGRNQRTLVWLKTELGCSHRSNMELWVRKLGVGMGCS